MGVLLSNAAFKPVCAIWQRDVSRYGWQKWQGRGKERQRSGTVDGKNGKDVSDAGYVHAAVCAVAHGCGWRVWRGMRWFKVLAARGGALFMELNYHKRGGKSRR
jgi:hypothetical protein